MERLAIVAILAVVAGLVALVLQRRRPPAEPSQLEWSVPGQIDRRDFARPDAPWLVAAFTSSTCETCADVWKRVQVLDSDEVVAEDVEVRQRAAVHKRYRIEAVPLVVVADRDGVVRWHCFGPLSATDLWGALAGLRDPGVLPPDCATGHG
jgi:hypothetical protein